MGDQASGGPAARPASTGPRRADHDAEGVLAGGGWVDAGEWTEHYPLGSRFAALAAQLFTADDVEEITRRIVSAAAGLVDGVDVASMTVLAQDGRFQTPVHTDVLAVRLDEVQYDTGHGPCLEAVRTGGIGVARCDDLATEDPPWPSFARAAVGLGVRSVLSVGLFPDSSPPRLGSLNLYARQPGALSDTDVEVVLLLAAHLATALAALLRAEVDRRQALTLREALDSRDVIGQAKGILMERHGMDADAAFDTLSRASQRLNIKLRDLAERLTKTRTVG
jgi:GAF domain-containing protein